jgi:hypothetical protein
MQDGVLSVFLIIAIIALVTATIAFSGLAYTFFKLYTAIVKLTKKGEDTLESGKNFVASLQEHKTAVNTVSAIIEIGKAIFGKKKSS